MSAAPAGLKVSRSSWQRVLSTWSRLPRAKAVKRDRITAAAVWARASPAMIGPQHCSRLELEPQGHWVMGFFIADKKVRRISRRPFIVSRLIIFLFSSS
jgi:hypothetical protein